MVLHRPIECTRLIGPYYGLSARPSGGVAVSWACEVFGATLQKSSGVAQRDFSARQAKESESLGFVHFLASNRLRIATYAIGG